MIRPQRAPIITPSRAIRRRRPGIWTPRPARPLRMMDPSEVSILCGGSDSVISTQLPPTQLKKWAGYAGHSGLSITVPLGQANEGAFGTNGAYLNSYWYYEMAACNTGYLLENINGEPTVVGYALFVDWGGLETGLTPGNYMFQGPGYSYYFIDQLMNDARSKGLKVVWVFNWYDFNGGGGSKQGPSATDGGTTGGLSGYGLAPAYLFNNASLYGAPQLGSNGGYANPSNPAVSGFYIQYDGGWSVNITPSGGECYARLLDLTGAIASAYDSDTAFGGLYINSFDANQPDNGCTALSSYLTVYQSLVQAVAAQFTRSNVYFAGGFASGTGGINAQQLAQNLISGGQLGGSSDSGGLILFSDAALNVTSFSYTNSGGSSSGNFKIAANVYASGRYALVLSTDQVLVVQATYNSGSGSFSFTAGETVTGSPSSAAQCSYFPASQTDTINAYMGIESAIGGWTPPSTPLYDISSYVGMVQPGDFQSSSISENLFPVLQSPQQICEAMVTAAPNGYGAALDFWSVITATPSPPPSGLLEGYPAALWGNGSDGGALNQLKNYPLINTGYPLCFP